MNPNEERVVDEGAAARLVFVTRCLDCDAVALDTHVWTSGGKSSVGGLPRSEESDCKHRNTESVLENVDTWSPDEQAREWLAEALLDDTVEA